MSVLAEFAPARELLGNFTLRELRGKYKGSALGWGWSLVNPLATMGIFTLVFHFVLRIPPPHGAGVTSYPLFLLTALLPWNFASSSMTGGMHALLGNANLIKKTYFPREVLVGSVVLATATTLGIEMLVLCVVFAAVGSLPFLWLPLALFYLVLLALFAFGLALVLSVANVYFRDTTHLVGILLQLWFYATPIIYPLQQVTRSAHAASVARRYHIITLFHVNPMTDYVEGVRQALYQHQVFALPWTGYAAGIAVVMLLVGYALFRKFEGRLAEEL